jgi:hypothetical protein
MRKYHRAPLQQGNADVPANSTQISPCKALEGPMQQSIEACTEVELRLPGAPAGAVSGCRRRLDILIDPCP